MMNRRTVTNRFCIDSDLMLVRVTNITDEKVEYMSLDDGRHSQLSLEAFEARFKPYQPDGPAPEQVEH